MKAPVHRWGAPAALVIALLALAESTTEFAEGAASKLARVVSSPRPFAVLRLDRKARFPAKAIPTVARARNADRLGGTSLTDVTLSCAPTSVDLGTWCLMAAPYALLNTEVGRNNYLFATRKCVELGGYLPTAAQLVGAAARVKLASKITDAQLTASIDLDPGDGLKDRREMSSTLVTTAAGSGAAGSQGVSDGSRGDPRQGEPDPVPMPANPTPDTLQYVTVYDNGDRGGFAGSRPVSEPENFRCAFDKVPGASADEDGAGQGTTGTP
ncbi:MAG: hypothetical protein H0W96_12160 [Solirubrobacterales bacterium]|nr:hypothetical protein [Solirubrobacterales bacterium]